MAPLSFSDRLAALTARERLFLGAGGAAVIAFAAWLASGSDELPPPQSAPPPPVAIAPAPPPIIAQPAAPLPAAPAVPPGLVLSGVMGSGAILTFPDGTQRAVPIGRDVVPGLTLKSVGIGHAILASAGGDMRLELNRFGGAVPSAAQPVATAPAPSGGADTPAARAVQKRETTAFRIGLKPERSGGYTIRPGARVPHLARAGLQPGDVILSVNGSALDEERLGELSWEIANASRTEFEYVRGGRRMKAILQGR